MTKTLNLVFEEKEFRRLKRAKKRLGFKTWKNMFLSLTNE